MNNELRNLQNDWPVNFKCQYKKKNQRKTEELFQIQGDKRDVCDSQSFHCKNVFGIIGKTQIGLKFRL